MLSRAVAAARARERELRKKELEQRRKATLKEVPVPTRPLYATLASSPVRLH